MNESRHLPTLLRTLEAFGANIWLARLRRGLNPELLAERAGIDVQTLLEIEAGRPEPSMGAYASVLFCLKLSGDLVRVGKDDPEGRTYTNARLGYAEPASRRRNG